MYLFFDELQRIDAWEDAVNAFRVDFNCDIYITGSNAHLLSSEYATYLSGRCVEIRMLPLSFREFLSFHDFEVREVSSALGGTRRQAFDENGERYDLREVFDAYMRFGGMPGIADIGLDQEKALSLLEGIYSTVVVRDILEREKRRGQRQITDSVLLRKIVLFLADNIGSSISASSISRTLMNEGLLEDEKRKGTPSTHHSCRHISMRCWKATFSMRSGVSISRAKHICARLPNIISSISGFGITCSDSATGTAVMQIQNVVYFELLRRGYDVAIGKVGSSEVDFIATTADDKKSTQVTESMQSEDTRRRELAPLQKIRDNYEKIVLSLEPGFDSSYDGIRIP